MRKWEYLTIDIRYDEKKHKDWIAQQGQQPPLVGMQAILGTLGYDGWELVCMAAERQQVWAGFGGWDTQVSGYRATFKRPIGEQV